MHPRNRYRENKPDFRDLAEHRPSLWPHLIKKKTSVAREAGRYPYTLDFSNSDALRELACAVLLKDFGLEVVLPVDRLAPMVPQRLNYIHWLEDLLEEEKEGGEGGEGGREGVEGGGREGETEKRKSVYGIDIGTGASCIYPLLGTVMNSWQFLATEIDDTSVQSALDNVSRNNLHDKIKVVKVPTSTTLIGAISDSQHYDFVMCNPPFFEDKKERYEGAQRTGHRPPPQTFSTGSEEETVTGGGELGFVRRILQDSLILRTQIRWYTSMLGKKASVKVICQELKQHQVPVVSTTRFVQGRTHRWAVAWSFDKSLACKVKDSASLYKTARKWSQVLTLKVSHGVEQTAVEKVLDQLCTSLTELEIEFSAVDGGEGDSSSCCRELVCEAHKNTWSQQRKRRRLRQKLQTLQMMKPAGDDTDRAQMSGTKGQISCSGDESGGRDLSLKVATHLTDSSDREGDMVGKVSSGKEGQQAVGHLEKTPSVRTASVQSHGSLLASNANQQTRAPPEQVAGCSESQGSAGQHIWHQIEALNRPCYVQFGCTALLSSSGQQDKDGLSVPASKRARLVETTATAQNPSEETVELVFEWIQGDDKDLLHQIVQYLKNSTFQHQVTHSDT